MKVVLSHMIIDLMATHEKGVPCLGQYNWQLKNQTNAIGAIHERYLFSVGLFDCKNQFRCFSFLDWAIPHTRLPENSVVVMDNAAFLRYSELLEQQRHKILWLPAYSPDLNAIEQMWAWVKLWLINSVDELFQFFESCK